MSIIRHKITLIAVIFCFIYALAFSLIAINRYWQYEVFYYDFGIFDTAIWKAAHLQAPVIDHFRIGGKWIFADHFNPSIFILSLLYLFTDKAEIILIAQAAIVSLSGFILFMMGRKISKNQVFSLGIMISFLLFIGIQNALITDFHEATIATLPLVLCFYFITLSKYKSYLLSLIILLGLKESYFSLGIALAVTILLINKKNWKLSLLTFFISVSWGFLAIKVIIPYFSNGVPYLYNPQPLSDPVKLLSSFTDSNIKINTVFISILSFGFLPLISYQFYFLIFADLISRFYPSFLTLSWGLGFHYSAVTGMLLAISSIFSYKILKNRLPHSFFTAIGIFLIILSLFLHRFVLHGPLGLAYNKAFYANTRHFNFLNKIIKIIPKNSSIMTHNNLAAHFTHQNIMLLRSKCLNCKIEYYKMIMPDYILIDSRQGQNINDFYGINSIDEIVKSLQKDNEYAPAYATKEQFIYKKVIH